MTAKYWVGIALLLSGALIAAFWISGSVVVRDPEDQLSSATVITGDGRTQPLHPLPGRFFYAAPKLEGDIQLRCRTGVVRRVGYVTPGGHEWRGIIGSDCRLSPPPPVAAESVHP